MTAKVRDAAGRRVIATDSAAELGEVKELVFAQPPTRVRGAWVTGGKRSARLVDWENLRLGPDTVMVDSESSLHEVSDDTEDRAVHRDRVLVGARVLDVHGFEHGKVDDVEIDSETGSVVAVFVGTGRIEPGQLRSLGTYALVVDSPPS